MPAQKRHVAEGGPRPCPVLPPASCPASPGKVCVGDRPPRDTVGGRSHGKQVSTQTSPVSRESPYAGVPQLSCGAFGRQSDSGCANSERITEIKTNNITHGEAPCRVGRGRRERTRGQREGRPEARPTCPPAGGLPPWQEAPRTSQGRGSPVHEGAGRDRQVALASQEAAPASSPMTDRGQWLCRPVLGAAIRLVLHCVPRRSWAGTL